MPPRAASRASSYLNSSGMAASFPSASAVRPNLRRAALALLDDRVHPPARRPAGPARLHVADAVGELVPQLLLEPLDLGDDFPADALEEGGIEGHRRDAGVDIHQGVAPAADVH